MKRFRRMVAVIGVAVAAIAGGLWVTQPAASADPLPLKDWNADVTTHVAGLVDQDVTIPTGKMNASVELTNGELTGDLDLPATTFSYNAVGFLPVTVTYHVDQVDPGLNGTVDLANKTLETEYSFNVRLSSVKAFGALELLDPASTCITTEVSVAKLSGTLNLEGDLSSELDGEYEIAPLTGCGGFNDIISGFTAGPGNTLHVVAKAPPAA